MVLPSVNIAKIYVGFQFTDMHDWHEFVCIAHCCAKELWGKIELDKQAEMPHSHHWLAAEFFDLLRLKWASLPLVAVAIVVGVNEISSLSRWTRASQNSAFSRVPATYKQLSRENEIFAEWEIKFPSNWFYLNSSLVEFQRWNSLSRFQRNLISAGVILCLISASYYVMARLNAMELAKLEEKYKKHPKALNIVDRIMVLKITSLILVVHLYLDCRSHQFRSIRVILDLQQLLNPQLRHL